MWEIDPEKLKAAMRDARMNQSELANAVGLQQPSIGRLLSGETRTTRKLDVIARALGTHYSKLLRHVPDKSEPQLSDRRLAFHGQEPENSDLVELAEVDLRYGMGGTFLDGFDSGEMRAFSRTWLRNFTRAAPESLYWAVGDGDSMEPTIRSGEVVLIDRSQDTMRMSEGIWAVALGEIGMIKRLHVPRAGEIELISDKPGIPPIVPGEGELQLIGRVVAVVRRL